MVRLASLLLVAPAAAQPYMKGFVRQYRNEVPEVYDMQASERVGLPHKVDWSETATTPIKNQGKCGSCWAFSATEGIESAYFMKYGRLPDPLSTQQVISCDKYDNGCYGGEHTQGLNYVKKAGGITTESNYPDKSHTSGESGTCSWDGDEVVEVKGYKYAVHPCNNPLDPMCLLQDEEGLVAALANHGPLSVCVNAADWGAKYDPSVNGGVFDQKCSAAFFDIDHCVQVVGYDHTAPTPYYKVRNSWGPGWGIDGFIRLPMWKNSCGIVNEAIMVSVESAKANRTVIV